MAFLAPDDRLVIMDINRQTYWGLGDQGHDYSLKVDEMKALADVGAKTVLQQLWWNAVEKDKKRDWTPVDIGIERAQEAGLKVLLQCYQQPPADLNPDWYLRKEDGTIVPHLSYWNEDAIAYEERFVRALAKRYAGPDVLIMSHPISDGENMLVHDPAWYDPAGLASYHRACGPGPMVLSRAKQSGWLKNSLIYKLIQWMGLLLEVQEHNEVWTSIHPLIEGKGIGNEYWLDMLRELRTAYPDASIVWLLYSFVNNIQDSWRQEKLIVSRQLTHNNPIQIVGGADHCRGLEVSAPMAKKENFRLLCGPRHDQIIPDQKTIDPWMLKAIGKAIAQLSAG